METDCPLSLLTIILPIICMKKELKMSVPHPFPATIRLMEQRSVSADDDEDEDSLVKLCGIVHERDHDQEEFSKLGFLFRFPDNKRAERRI
uniref:Uncharacterized protein n=1 Tax=Globodera rostochiensis TaxID=31243 RepID=A0A914I7U9_GLORO